MSRQKILHQNAKNPDQQKIKLMQSTALISVPLEAFLVTMDNCQDMTSLLLFEHFLAHADNHEIESNITRKTGLKCEVSRFLMYKYINNHLFCFEKKYSYVFKG